MKAVPEVMSPICYVGPQCPMVVWERLNLPVSILFRFVAMWRMSDCPSADEMASDMLKQWCVINSFMWKTHWRSLAPADGDQPVDINTVKWWVAHFSSGGGDMKDEPCSGWPWRSVTPLNEEHLRSAWIDGLQAVSCVWTWISASVCWKQWWQH